MPLMSMPLQLTLAVELVTLPAEVLRLKPKSPSVISALLISMNDFSAQMAARPRSRFPQPLLVLESVISLRTKGVMEDPEE